ncbi:MAG TPA: hypothetical protein VN152_00950, partial [Sphingopyxis sp.]|nr:hypothetical protein [Sphingopyxis sp.]
FSAPAPANEAPLEWPRRAPEPVIDGPAPFAAPAEPARVVTLSAPDVEGDDILELAPETPAAPAIDPEHLAALEAQIASLEERLVEQDAALRRVLDLLIEWVERDPDNAPNPATSQTWAA